MTILHWEVEVTVCSVLKKKPKPVENLPESRTRSPATVCPSDHHSCKKEVQ